MEERMIRQCQQGDIEAFHWIYNRYEQGLLGTALRMLGNRQDAEDAVQTTFMKLYRAVNSYRFESKFSTYLFRIHMNVCFDSRRMKKPGEELRETQDPSHIDLDLRIQLGKAIAGLPDRMKACFVLFAVEDMRQEEIAEILGLSLGGVKSNIFHAKARLRKLLADVPEGATR